jgi:hypothetical protein
MPRFQLGGQSLFLARHGRRFAWRTECGPDLNERIVQVGLSAEGLVYHPLVGRERFQGGL